MNTENAHERWLVLVIVSSALFLISVDLTVLYTALPSLAQDLEASSSERLWIVNAYPLVTGGLLISTGTLGDRLGHRRLFLVGLAVFGLASIVAAFAPSAEVLIAARAALALGAAIMMPATLSIIRLVFTDDRERGIAIGIWAAVGTGGAACGPVLGGILLEFFWWGSVFLINVPVVLIALLATLWIVPAFPGDRSRTWNASSGIVVMIGLGGVILAIKEVGAIAPDWNFAVASALSGMCLLAWFVRSQLRMSNPMVDFHMLRNRAFSSGILAAMVSMFVMIGMLLVYSQRLQLVVGLTPLEAALVMTPLSLAALVAGPLAGAAAHALGIVRLIWTSLLLTALGLAGLALTFDSGFMAQLLPLLIIGGGIGAVMTAASTAIMVNAPAEKAGLAASIEEISYEFGSMLGVALLGTILSFAYTRSFGLPGGMEVPVAVRDSIDAAIAHAGKLEPLQAELFLAASYKAFDRGFHAAIGTSLAILVISAAAILLTTRRSGA